MEKRTMVEMAKVIAQLQNEIDYLSEALAQERAKNADQKEGRNREVETKRSHFDDENMGERLRQEP